MSGRPRRQGWLPETWYLAICRDCTPVLPQPFHDFEERAKWTRAHRDGTGHTVTYEEERSRGADVMDRVPEGLRSRP
jgi:hypothetical protein